MQNRQSRQYRRNHHRPSFDDSDTLVRCWYRREDRVSGDQIDEHVCLVRLSGMPFDFFFFFLFVSRLRSSTLLINVRGFANASAVVALRRSLIKDWQLPSGR